jgi:hypothetical protein
MIIENTGRPRQVSVAGKVIRIRPGTNGYPDYPGLVEAISGCSNLKAIAAAGRVSNRNTTILKNTVFDKALSIVQPGEGIRLTEEKVEKPTYSYPRKKKSKQVIVESEVANGNEPDSI